VPIYPISYQFPESDLQSSELAWANQIGIDRLQLTDVDLYKTGNAELSFETNHAGTLGLNALSRMDMVVDYKGGFAYLWPRPRPAEARVMPLSEYMAECSRNWIADPSVKINFDRIRSRSYFLSGLARQAGGDSAGAIADQTRAIELDPDNFDACLARALARRSQGDAAGAEADFKRIDAFADNSIAFLNRGAVRPEPEYDLAMADFNRVIEIDAYNSAAYNNRGYIKKVRGDHAGASADYNRAIELDPRYVVAYINRGNLKYDTGDPVGALADFDRALTLDPTRSRVYINRAYAKPRTGDQAGAIADCARAIELDPKDPILYHHRGTIHLNCGRFDEALTDFDREIELKPDDSTYPQLYRQLLQLRLGKPTTDFAANVSQWKSAWPKNIGRFLMGNLDEAALLAAAETKHAEPVNGQKCEAFYYIGMMRLLNKDPAGAREFFQKSLDTGEKDYDEYAFARAEIARLDVRGP
jgi:tetratricopeptide (TPR) repeat protein